MYIPFETLFVPAIIMLVCALIVLIVEIYKK